MKTLYCFDLDGTILDVSELYKKAGIEPDRALEPEKHKKWIEQVIPKFPLMAIRGAIPLLKALYSSDEIDIIYLTGRTEKYRRITERNLVDLIPKFSPAQLFMRLNNDNRDYAEYKEEVILRFQESYQNIVVFDDDPNHSLQVFCKKYGWTFYKSCTGGY